MQFTIFKFLLLNELVSLNKVDTICFNSYTEAKFIIPITKIGDNIIDTLHISFDECNPHILKVCYSYSKSNFKKNKAFTPYQFKNFLNRLNILNED
jgi:hypothetical protein